MKHGHDTNYYELQHLPCATPHMNNLFSAALTVVLVQTTSMLLYLMYLYHCPIIARSISFLDLMVITFIDHANQFAFDEFMSALTRSKDIQLLTT